MKLRTSVGRFLAALPLVISASAMPSRANAAEPTEPSPCPQDRVRVLVHELTDWTRALNENERRLRAERGCDAANVVCLDRLGEPGPEPMPSRVVAGRPLSVYAILPSFDRGRVTISTSMRASTAQSQVAAEPDPVAKQAASDFTPEPSCKLLDHQRAALKAAAMPIARFASQPGLEAIAVPAESSTDAYWSSTDDTKILNEWLAWQKSPRPSPRFTALRSRMEVPAGDVLSVDFVRVEPNARTPSIEKHYELVIDNGRYYVEPAVMVPLIYKGSRTVGVFPTVSGTQQLVSIDEDWRVTAAVTLNVFPFGRQKGQVSSFRYCRLRTCLDNWLGIQVGAGVDPFLRDWYLGLVFEPVSGVTAGIGATMTRGEFLAAGRAEGMLLPSPTALAKNSQYMIRPYFSLSFTLDIFETLDRAATASKRLLF